MRAIIHILIVTILTNDLFPQDSQVAESSSMQGAFGAVTIDGKIWNQISLRPILPFGHLSIANDCIDSTSSLTLMGSGFVLTPSLSMMIPN